MSSAASPAAALDAAPPDPGLFVATTTSVDPERWPATAVPAAADTGILVAGRARLVASTGSAAVLPLPRGLEDEGALVSVRAWLSAVERPGDGPVPMALGAFAFDRGEPARLVVPAVSWCRDPEGRTWRTEVRRRDAGADEQAAGDGDGREAGHATVPEPARLATPTVTQVPPPAAYADAVARAVADIRDGRLRKVVLGRMVELGLPAPAVPSRLLATLWAGDRVFSPFSVPTPAGRLVGASPELVLARLGRTVTSHAFAGTVPLPAGGDGAGSDSTGPRPSGGDGAERLFDSEKDRREHRLVVEEIAGALGQRCVALTVPAEPTVVRLRSDARLGTLISGTLTSEPAGGDTALALLALLHPTPAVGGVPRDAAVERIAALEAAPRGYWAGAVGWTDAAGDGEWVLGIRSVELHGATALVRAGAGIVEGSDPEAELAETTVKLRPVLDALWPGLAAHL